MSKSPSDKVALICGVSGQDGAYLARYLLQKGYVVTGTSRDAEAGHFSNLKRLGIDTSVELTSMAINDFRSVVSVLGECMPDEIYNLAGQSSVALSFSQPVETYKSIASGTLNILEAIRLLRLDTRFYNAGSSECFGEIEDDAASESTAFRPCSPYGVAKATSVWQTANYRQAYDMYAVSGILFNHESPLRHRRFATQKIVNAVCDIAEGGCQELVLGNLDIERDWGWAPEYVEAMWRMLQQDNPTDLVIGTGVSTSLQDFVSLAFSRFDMNWEDYVRTNPQFMRPADIKRNRADPSLAKKLIGWKAKMRVADIVNNMIDAELQNRSSLKS